MIWFLLLTAFTVSMDSLFCGFSLSLSHKKKLPIIITITLIVFLMCLATNYLAAFMSNKYNTKASFVGGLLLIAIGICNLFNNKKTLPENDRVFNQSIIVGLAVGVDGALANLSLAIMNINYIHVPIVIAITHGLMIWLGSIIAQSRIVGKIQKYTFVPPLILILLGAYKIFCLLI